MSSLNLCHIYFGVFFVLNVSAQTTTNETLDRLLNDYTANSAPGFSVKVIEGANTIYNKGFGLSNLDYNIKNSDLTVFDIASIAKQFTASAIWSLMKDNKISLEDDIRTYLPEFPQYEKVIQIKHLLNHSSGIRNYHTLMHLSGFDYNTDYYDNNTVLELAIKQKNLNHLPGEKITYSNTNYNLLTIIVERISGQNLNGYLRHHILKPLQLNSTFVRIEHGKPIKNKAIGYKTDATGFRYSTTNQLSYGAGSIYSTVNDLATWTHMLNENYPKFNALAQFLKTTEYLLSGERATYARGLTIDHYKDYETVGHSGQAYGGSSQIIAIKEKQLGIVVLTNSQQINATRIAYQILDELFIHEKSTPKEETTSFEAQNPNTFVGDYKEVSSDMTMSIFVENDTLKSVGSMGNTPIALKQFAKNKFHRFQSEHVKYVFTKTETHDMIIYFGGTPFYFKKANLIKEDYVNVLDFIGDYYSEELGVSYHFSAEGKDLKLTYNGHETMSLRPIQLNQFGNNDRTLYHFVKDSNDKVTGMLLSCDGTVKDIRFKKEKDR